MKIPKTTNQAKYDDDAMQRWSFFDSVDSVSCKKDIFSLWWARDAIVSSRQQQKNCIGGAAAADCCTFLIAFQSRGDEHFGLIVYLSQQTEPMNCKLYLLSNLKYLSCIVCSSGSMLVSTLEDNLFWSLEAAMNISETEGFHFYFRKLSNED